MIPDKRIVIIGATSGIGLEVAKLYLQRGWRLGIAGRRMERLEEFRALAPERVEVESMDVTHPDAPDRLLALIERLGGMDIFFYSSGIGFQNPQLDLEVEQRTLLTNVGGFGRMLITAFHYFKNNPLQQGHVAVISSVAGTRGLGVAPAYSASKRFQNHYIDCLAQLARMQRIKVTFTDIRPGFVATDLLQGGRYPLLMQVNKVALLIVKALDRKKRRVVIDRRYALLVFFWRLIPACIWERLKVKNR